jgi:hypothetical protein
LDSINQSSVSLGYIFNEPQKTRAAVETLPRVHPVCPATNSSNLLKLKRARLS